MIFSLESSYNILLYLLNKLPTDDRICTSLFLCKKVFGYAYFLECLTSFVSFLSVLMIELQS